MKKRWSETEARMFLEKKGVRFEGRYIINSGRLGNGGGGAFDYLINHCGYKAM